MVIATQNPVDHESTFSLPESQMDRFLLHLEMGYPDFEHELEILKHGKFHYDHLKADPVVSCDEVIELQSYAKDVFVEDTVLEYMVRFIRATREEQAFRSGVSPRGALSLKLASQARALLLGRAFVLPEDVVAMLFPVLGHRLTLRHSLAEPMEARRSVDALLSKIAEQVADPIDSR